MAKDKKRPNYFRITSPRRRKIFYGLLSVILAIAFVLLAIDIVALIDLHLAKPGIAITSLFPGLMPFFEVMLRAVLVLFMAFSAVVIYNYITNRENIQAVKAESPLQGAAVEHEEQIIDALKIIAKPLPGRAKLNRARTAQFIRALMELGYIDKNTAGKILMVWVETVTEYKDGNASHFQKAIKDATPQDSNVLDFQKQIQEIIAK